ncbi:MAG: septum formation family protein [Streptosporangiaceae bacterium]
MKAGPAQAEPAAGEPAAAPEGELAAGAPGEADLAETELAEAGHSEGELAEGELAEAGPADAELAGTGAPGLDAAEEHRDVSPLAVAGIILGILALVGAAVGVLAVITHGFRPKTVITYRPAAVFGLRPGECINSARNGLNVTVLSCATPHDAEVFATFSLPQGSWPGASAVQQDAGNGCASRLGGYLNPQLASAALSQEYVYPNHAAWQAGERTVVCEVSAVSGQLTGSVRASS